MKKYKGNTTTIVWVSNLIPVEGKEIMLDNCFWTVKAILKIKGEEYGKTYYKVVLQLIETRFERLERRQEETKKQALNDELIYIKTMVDIDMQLKEHDRAFENIWKEIDTIKEKSTISKPKPSNILVYMHCDADKNVSFIAECPKCRAHISSSKNPLITRDKIQQRGIHYCYHCGVELSASEIEIDPDKYSTSMQ